MSYEALVADIPVLKSAVVTLDVLTSGVIWGWFVTMNMWAKSVGTGVFLVGLYMLNRYKEHDTFFKIRIPIIGIIFIALTLLFTALDLHQMFRAWHMFVYPHMTSVINIGSWFINIYMAILTLMFWANYKNDPTLFNKLIIPGAVMAFLTTIYTAGLMGQSNAREVWQTPAEVFSMLLAAGIGGSAILLILGRTLLPDEQKLSLAWILGLSASMSLVLFSAELIFAPFKSEEAEWVMHYLLHGELAAFFLLGLCIAFVVPTIIIAMAIRSKTTATLTLASLLSLIGLWMVKHAWLIAPQMIPLS